MAQEKILGNQLNIADVASDLNPALTTDLVTDTSPQLGGNLDANGYNIVTANSTTAATPNAIEIVAGYNADPGHYSNAGNVNIRGGAGYDNNYAGHTKIYGGAGYGTGGYSQAHGGTVGIYGGNSINSNYGIGGHINIYAGEGSGGNNTGGDVSIHAGDTSASSNSRGGELTIRGGNSSLDTGGAVTIQGGATNGENFAPKTSIFGSSASGTQAAGDVQIFGGVNSSTGAGGEVFIKGGRSASTGTGGDIIMTPGGGIGTTTGTLNIHTGEFLIGQAEIQLWNDTNTAHNTGNYVALKAPATAANRTWILPDDDPAAIGGGSPLGTQFLTTDASGNLSFAAASSDLVNDTSPQLGANLDVNDFDIVGKPAATVTSNGNNVTILGSAGGATSGQGGAVFIDGGDGDGTLSANGKVQLRGGSAGHADSARSIISLLSSSGSLHNGGNLLMESGASGDANSDGGLLRIEAGGSGGTAGDGGDIQINAGNSNVGQGGDIILDPGTSGSGTAGAVVVGGSLAFDAVIANTTAVAIDWADGNIQTATPTAATVVTYTFAAPTGPARLTMIATNLAATTSVAWPATVKWPGGTEPTWSAAAIDKIEFIFDGTDYLGTAELAFA